MFRGFMDIAMEKPHMEYTHLNVKAMLELFEASHLALEGEKMLDDAKVFFAGILKNIISSNSNDKLAKQLAHAMELPLHWRVQWYEVRQHILAHEQEDKPNSILLELAKINFNMVQATHQKDLMGIAR
uniref:Terpene synthase N-terminal domain-containing protein n=2 Tax=Davidia involucrata TaxID=16924 RepID=A0A5B7BNN6_DAVIN